MEIKEVASSVPLLESEHGDKRDSSSSSSSSSSTGNCGLWHGDCIKSVVYSGLDAIVKSFSLISSISGSHLSSGDALVLGFANLVAEGISMGLGNLLSSSTEKDMEERERATEEQNAANSIGKQQEELLKTYQDLGMDLEDAATVVNAFSKYKHILVDEKMTSQNGGIPPNQSAKPWKTTLITFFAFILFGAIPLLSYIILIPFAEKDSSKFSMPDLRHLSRPFRAIEGQNFWPEVSAFHCGDSSERWHCWGKCISDRVDA